MVVTGGLSGLNIEGKPITPSASRLIAAGPTTGTVQEQLRLGTKGWVLEGDDVTLTGDALGHQRERECDMAIIDIV